MVASARVLSSQRCSSLRLSTRRIASNSVTRPNTAPTTTAPNNPMYQGRPSAVMKNAPKTPPSIAMWPVATDNTFEVEYITL